MPKQKPKSELDDIELHPDAWDRFERAIKTMPRTPAQPRKSAPKAKAPARKRPKKA
ncbi:MAG TPA: hypothetical protein VG889_20690 [Rhizomicrobium sp.]|nr:hypothetical protein [Rhizomicrobium sp.]